MNVASGALRFTVGYEKKSCVNQSREILRLVRRDELSGGDTPMEAVQSGVRRVTILTRMDLYNAAESYLFN